jgi:Protein of unknown function (DUF4233)
MSAVSEPADRPPRVRRQRTLRESLLSIVLGLEAAVMFFATLTINGLTALGPAVVLIGGAVFIVVLVVVAGLQRYVGGVVAGAVLQGVIIATGVLTPFMYVIGAGFAALWVWCFVRARRIDQRGPRAVAEGETS